jgi:hypothetical protein
MYESLHEVSGESDSSHINPKGKWRLYSENLHLHLISSPATGIAAGLKLQGVTSVLHKDE